MKFTTIALVLFSAALALAADTSCSATVQLRKTAVLANGGVTYSVNVANTGSCMLQDVSFDSNAVGASVSANLAATANIFQYRGGIYFVLGYGAGLTAGTSYSGSVVTLTYRNGATVQDTIDIQANLKCSQFCGRVPFSGCAAVARSELRAGSQTLDPSNNNLLVTFDVYVRNAGTCNLNDVILSFNAPDATIKSTTFTAAQGGYLATDGNGAASGSIQVSFPSSGYAPTVDTSLLARCSASCGTTRPACTSTVTITARSGNTWTDANGKTNAIFDVTVKNTGTSTIKAVNVEILHSTSTFTNSWNLGATSTANQYALQNFYELAAGQTFTGAGFIAAFNAGSTIDASAFAARIVQSTCA